MDSSRKGPARKRRRRLKTAAFCASLLFLLLFAGDVILFLRGTAITDYIETKLSARTGNEFFIGRLTTAGLRKIAARDVYVRLASGETVSIPRLDLRLAPGSGTFVEVTTAELIAPVAFLTGTTPPPGTGGAPPVFPLKRLSVKGGRIIVPSRYARAVGPIDFSLEQARGSSLRLSGTVSLPPLPLPVEVDLLFDPANLRGAAGTAELRGVRLNSLGPALPVSGLLDVDLSLAGTGGRQVLTARGGVSEFTYLGQPEGTPFSGGFDLAIGTGDGGGLTLEGRASLTGQGPFGGRHEAAFNLLLGRSLKSVEQAELSLRSPLLGDWKAGGTVLLGDEGPRGEINATFDGLDLASFAAALPPAAREGNPYAAGRAEGRIHVLQLPGKPPEAEGSISLRAPPLPPGTLMARWMPPAADWNFRIALDAIRRRLVIDSLDTVVAGEIPLAIRGSVSFPVGEGISFDLAAALPWLRTAKIARFFDRRDIALPPLRRLKGETMAALHLNSAGGVLSYDGRVMLREGSYDSAAVAAAGLSAELSFSGGRHLFNVDGFRAEAAEVRSGNPSSFWEARRAVLSLTSLEGNIPAGEDVAADVSLTSSRLRVPFGGNGGLRLDDPSLQLSARLAGDRKSCSWSGLSFRGLPGVDLESSGRFRWDRGPAGTFDVKLPFDAAAAAELLQGLPAPFSPPGLAGAGTVRATVTISSPDGDRPSVRVDAAMDLGDGSWSSPDGAAAAAGIDFSGESSVRFSLPAERFSYSLSGRAEGFEVLVDPYYSDFSGSPLVASLTGTVERSGGLRRPESMSLSLENILTLRWEGGGETAPADGRITLDIDDLGLAYDLLVRENVIEASPFLGGLVVDGKAALAADVSDTAFPFSAQGLLEATLHSASLPDGSFSLAGVRLGLPFDFRTGDDKDAGSPGFGSLFVEEGRIGPLTLRRLEASPVIRRGDLLFEGTVTVPLFGGEVTLERPSWKNLSTEGRTLQLAGGVNEVDMGLLFPALGLPAVEGRVEGRLENLELTGGDLRGDGRIAASLFGGILTFTDFTGRGVAGPVPAFGFSVEAAGIDLEAITETFDFGKVSGIAGGYARDVVVAAGQVQHFDAHFETDRRRGVPQKISVEALEKISILGSGGRPDIFSRGVMQLFKEYNYAKIGFTASLRNDHLTLAGVGKDGERTYLVKGGLLPPKANVISHSREISFGELVERLARIGRVGEDSDE